MKPSSNSAEKGLLARLKGLFKSVGQPENAINPPEVGMPADPKLAASKPEHRVVEVPQRTGKTGLNELKDLPKEHFENPSQLHAHEKAGFYFHDGDFRYDFLFAKGTEPRLFVIFSGDIDRRKITPPAFQRWTWSDKFPGHCLFISDPSLHLDPALGLAWYVGTADVDFSPTIRRLVREIAAELEIPSGNLYAYGSSGGGFAALRLASIMPDLVPIAINPQTDVLKYSNGTVDRCVRVCFSCSSRTEAEEKFGDRLSLISMIDRFKGRRIIYAQNRLDEHHYTTHYRPFITELGLEFDREYRSEEASVILFDHPDGHRKAETAEVFNEIMELVNR